MANSFDVQHYRIEMDWSTSLIEGNNYFTGKVTATILVDTVSLNTITFHSYSLEIDSVKIGGTIVGHQLTAGRLAFSLDRPYVRGEQLSVEIYYTHPDSSSRYVSFSFESANADLPEPVAYTMSVPYRAHFWYPCYDNPADKAKLDVFVIVPSSFVVVSNGTLVDQSPRNGGERLLFHWREVHPIWTSTAFVAASRYTILKSSFRSGAEHKEVQLYVWPVDTSGTAYNARRNLPAIVEVLEFYSRNFADYPFDNFKVAVTGDRGWIISNQTIIQAPRDIFHVSETLPGVWPHEIAHQWFGNYVNARSFGELWLNEGFASYSEALYAENRGGSAALRERMYTFAFGAMNRDTSLVNPPYPYHFAIYNKGACVLDMLRYCLGDSTFWSFIRTYLTRFEYEAASTEDLVAVVNEVAGKDYGWFFNQWVYKAGFPIYDITWNSRDLLNEWRELSIRVNQVQSEAEVFIMPLPFTVRTDRGDTTVIFPNSARSQVSVLQTHGKPRSLLFDTDNRILLKRTNSITNVAERVSPLPKRFELAQNHPNPFRASTVIRYELPKISFVTLEIYNLLGQKLRTLVEEERLAGAHEAHWDGRDDRNRAVSAGLYFYRLTAGEWIKIRKAILLQ